ncbi:MAG TPA: hypothetical protein P5265_13140 [Bacteroidia bacterium]|nr:hypothetical protein [Bacteroidales bacterium]HQG57078.1 hypothetical protein [Bacteroidales bacterium]HRU69424.1 hypothetical protein [Bacteroidia bacterium]
MKTKVLNYAFGVFLSMMILLNIGIITDVKATAPGEGGDSWACNHCNIAGGPGATSCSCKVELPGMILSECSVTVSNGYYACCRTTWSDRCICLSCSAGE